MELGIPADERLINRFLAYMDGILSWNDKVNLTAITDREEFIRKHFLDSLTCSPFPEMEEADKIIDVGTGAGFPGIPLALVFPDKQFVLMDSLKKRLKIIDELTEELGIANVRTLHGRAEDLARMKEHREQYDLCVSRAVASLAVLSEYTLPFLKVGGTLLAYKGPEALQEIKSSGGTVRTLGGILSEERRVTIPGLESSHVILIINKIKHTPASYPRRAGTPAKEPLK
jgi:16S rRNA (guanine527-N7)-methyltransferase